MKRTPETCWKELEPAFIQLNNMIASAPLPDNERIGLAILMLTHCIAAAGMVSFNANGKNGRVEAHSRELVELVMQAAFQDKRPSLQVVT